MPLSDVVNVSISVSGAGPTAAGFGEPMLACLHTKYTDRVREYSSLSDVAVDFAVTDAAYLMAAEVFSQTPCPPFLKIGRRANAYTQILHLKILSTTVTDTYVIQLRTPGGTWHTVSVACTGTKATDVASINTAVTALSLAHLTATNDSTDTLILTMAAGYLLDVQPGPATLIQFSDVTVDPAGGGGLAADLNAIMAADPAWYGLLLDSQSPAEVGVAAVWTEANKYFCVYNVSDSACGDPASTTDVFYTEKALSHTRTAGLFAQTQLLCYSAAAWMGRLFPTSPGSENWAFKTLAGVPVDALTTAQIHAVENKNASVYTALAGLNLTQFGKRPDGEWMDITRGVDALTNTIQIGVLALQANNLKVPYTDAGVDMYRSVLASALKQFMNSGFLADSPAPTISLPKVASVSSTNKIARVLPNVNFAATFAGAINSTTINGVLTQ